MTAYATRAPLQLINNPHMMSEARGHGRRTSKRLEEKEDALVVNDIGLENEIVRGSQKDTVKLGKAKVNGTSLKPAAKRKPGEWLRAQTTVWWIGNSPLSGPGYVVSDALILLAAYDEEDDGFAFTRTRAKKAKAAPVLPTTIEEDKQESKVEPAPTKRPKKKSEGSPSAPAMESDTKVGKRRSARHSSEHEKGSADPPTLQVKKRRKDRGSSEMKADQKDEKSQTQHEPPPHEAARDHAQPIEITFDATKIALPFADTPRIQRNKDMRKTNAARRSSLGLRGRRASSLIDSGKSTGNAVFRQYNDGSTDSETAMPHDEVESSEFYKHIESDGLSEPRRMKQLLTWCGTRALGEKPSFSSEDSNARLAGVLAEYSI